MDTARLKKIGLKKAAETIDELQSIKRRMIIAYEHFRYVKQDKIDAFNEKLKKETLKRSGKEGVNAYHDYDKLRFRSLEEYPQVPPVAVLDAIEQAQEKKCFDTFEVCDVESVHEYKDPIVFGRINKCPDRFFVAQWDDDVRIEDILKENEG